MPHSIDDPLLPNFPAAMGVSLQEVSDSRIVGVMDVTDEHANRNGVMHGGAIMAFADSLGGVAAAANLTDGQSTTTLESKTNFLRPVRIGERITGECVALHKGRKTTIWQTTLFRSDGKPASITTQTQMTLIWTATD